MKNLILGIMIVAAPTVFAQNSDAVHAKFKVSQQEQRMAPVSLLKKEAVASPIKRRIQYSGVVHMRDGMAIIVIDGQRANNRVYAVNLPEAYAVDGKSILFNARPSRAPMPVGIKCDRVVTVSDLAIPK